MDNSFYFNTLYPFQDEVLKAVHLLDTGFYLTGGTATSRGYLNHRFSDDLDMFVNDDSQFMLWAERIIQTLNHSSKWKLDVLNRDDRFYISARLLLKGYITLIG